MIKKCNHITNKSEIVKKENKRKAVLHNPSHIPINEVKVDGCLITQNNKCDYLWEICYKKHVIYIELKGKNLSHALTQIQQTIKHCITYYNHSNFKKTAVIVLSRYPQEDSSIQNKKKQLKKQGIKLEVKNNKWEGSV